MTGPRIVQPGDEALQAAADRLARGDLVVLPTETVYGLAGSTVDMVAIEKIYRLKGRPGDNPLIAHVTGATEASSIVHGWNDLCADLADRFWPGPLTLILRRHESVPSIASGGRSTLAVRCPSHPVARSLLERFGGPVSAPSANRSGAVSPTCADHVLMDYRDVQEADDLLILDGGTCDVGIESTVLDLSGSDPRILRPGVLTSDDLAEVMEVATFHPTEVQGASPGTTASHYATHAPLELLDRASIEKRLETTDEHVGAILLGGTAPAGNVIILDPDPNTCAKALYSSLRTLDETGPDRILFQRPPDGVEWDAIRDRLQRASVQVSTTRSAGGGSSGGSS
ncbi:MAG: threonylcarbamoyl-AMP synthase [Phycisphaerae bacterium]|nr:threonylcarbamoyl-AMP synthase [Phycisphaerae bacterium]